MVLCLLALLTMGGGSAQAYRGVPVGLYNVNNQVMNSPGYVYGLRFVPDHDTTLYRFISGFNLEGSDQLGGRDGYSDGSGGTILARLVAVKPNGEPDLSQVLASERVGAWQRYTESKAAYGVSGVTQLLYFNMGGVQLRAGQMYAMTYQNVDSSPAANWFSENSPTVKESVAGPNGVNNTDPNAPGAIDGLDPREAVAWSADGGSTWVWGRHAGEGETPGAYGGSASSDDGTRLPWYGWQTSAAAAPESNQPYYAYREQGSYTLKVSSVATEETLTEAGGYAPVGSSAGVLTVRNTTTGASGRTGPLGSGLVRGALDKPVTVKPGQSYEISNSGTVMKAEADSFIQSTFKVSAAWDDLSAVSVSERAEMFAESSGAPAAAPAAAIVVRRATVREGRHHAAAPTHAKAVRLMLVGRVRSGGRPGLAVKVQLRIHSHWRKVGHTKLRRNGRFVLHCRRRLPEVKTLRARAIARGIGRSKSAQVAIHR